MRTKEQFKAYVYEKANEKRVLQKRNRMVFARGLAAFSLLFVISGALVYGNFLSKNNYAVERCNTYGKGSGNEFYYFSKSALADSVDDGMSETVLCAETVEEMQGIVLEASTIQNYSANIANIPRGFSFENDIADYKLEIEDIACDAGTVDQSEALEIAKEKCTIEYNVTDVFYDSEACIWKIVFYTRNTVGGCQTVYINQDGSIRLIVYGE